MKKSIIVIVLLFFTGFAFSQTTVTLQDQCNCEVLSGTAVTSAGAVLPGGADSGDIYVNTNTGTIYFWDGDSWELTSTDDQQLTGFTFDGATNELTLTLENGGSVNVDLSSLSDTLTDTNTTITSFGIDTANTNLVITDSDTNTFSVALADIAALVDTDTDSQDLSISGNELSLSGDPTATPIDLSLYLDNTDSQNAGAVPFTATGNTTSTDVQSAIEEIQTELDGVDGTDDQDLTLTGNTLAISGDPNTDVDLSAYLDNTDSQNAGAVPFTATGNTTSTDVQSAIEEIQTELDGVDGTDDQDLTLTGNTLAISGDPNTDVDLSLYLDNTDSQNAGAVPFTATGNTTSTDVQSAIEEIQTELDGVDGTDDQDLTLTGNTLAISGDPNTDVDLSLYLDNTDSQNAGAVPFTATGNTTSTDVQSAIEEIQTELDGVDGTDDQDLTLTGNTLAISGDPNTDVDLSLYLDNTDSQNAGAVPFTATGNTTSTDVQSAIEEIQTELDGVDGTDDQDLTLTGNTLAISGDPNTDVDLSLYLDNTDSQNAGAVPFTATGNTTSTDVQSAIEEIQTELDGVDGTDDQDLTLTGNTLAISGDPNTDVDLSLYLDNTDSQNAGAVPFTATGNTTSTDVQSAIEEIQTELDGVDGTDDQDLTLTGNTLAISGDPNTDVDLSLYLDNTDSQNAGAVPFTATGNTTSTDVQSAIEEIQTELDGVDGTDDQDLTLTGNTLAISGDPNTDVDLSLYLDNTDSQNAGAVPFTATGNTTSTDVQSAIEEIQTELDGVDGTDDQDLTLTGNTLAISGDPNTDVDLSLYLDNTDSQNAGAVPFTATGNTTSTDVQSAIEEIQTELDGVDGTDDQDLTLTGNTLAISGDPNTDVDLSLYLDNTDSQNAGAVPFTATGNTTSTDVQSAIEEIQTELDGVDGTDDQDLQNFQVNGANLEISIQDGNTVNVPLADIDTDDQTASEVTVADTGGNFTNSEVEGVLEEIDARIDALVLAGGSDGNDFVTGGSLSGTDLTLNVPNQIDPVIDLSGLQDGTGTDNQDLTLTGNTLAISGDPNTDVDLSLYLDNTDSQNAGAVPFTATGNTTSTDVQSAIEEIQTELDGVDGTDDQDLTLTGNTLAISGDPNTDVDLSAYLDNTDSQNAGAVPFTATGNTTSTDVQSAIEEIQTELDGVDGTDDQDLTLTGNTLAISGDPNTDVDLSLYLDNTDSQNAGAVPFTATGNTTSTDVQSAIEEIQTELDGVDGTDDQDLTLTGNTLAISGDPNTDVDLSLYLDNTDSQNAGAVPFTATGNTTSTDVQSAIEEIQTELDGVDGTDDQDLTLTGNTLAISGDPNTDVDLSLYLDNTDSQNAGAVPFTATGNTTSTDVQSAIEEIQTELDGVDGTDDQDLTLTGNTLAISGDPNTDVDLSAYLDNTDSQNAGAVPFTATGNTTSTDVQSAIEEIQTELDGVDGTDDQDLTLTGNTLAISGDPNTDVDLSLYLDNTDSQNAGAVPFTATGNTTSTDVQSAIEEIQTELDGVDGTDDQDLTLTGNTLAISGDPNTDVDLSLYLDNTDSQNAGAVPFTATGNTTSTDVQSAIEEIQTELDGVDGTDDQDLTLTGNTLAISGDPNTDVDLSAYLDNTDSQNAGAVPFTATGNTTSTDVQSAIEEIQTELDGVDGTDDQDLTLTGNTLAISGDPNTDVDLSAYLDNTDSQNAGAVPFTATGNTTSTDVQSAIEEIQTELDGVDGTDDQDLTLTGNTLAISGDPNTDVDLSLYLDNTDSQNAGAVPFTATGNTTSTDVQSAIEEIQTELDGVDGTDDQDLTLTGNTLAISGDPNTDVDLSLYLDNTDSQNAGAVPFTATGNTTSTDVQSAIEEIQTELDGVDGTDDQDLTLTGNTLAISGDPNTDVDLSLYLDNTDSQNAGAVPFTATGNTTSTDVQSAIEEIQTELDGVDGTDDQDLTLTGNTLAISGDPNTDVDLSAYLDNTDSQNAGAVPFTATGNTTSTDVQSAIEEIQTELDGVDGTDDQDLTLTGNTLAISGDPNTDVDLSAYLDNTDSQNAGAVPFTATGNTTSTDVQSAIEEIQTELDGVDGTDDQDLTLTGNTLAISGDPNTDVDLSLYLDNTDSQNAGAVPFTATGNTTSTDVQSAIEEIQTELDGVDGTDDQDLTLTGNTLAISGDPNTDVDLSLYLDNTDSQNAGAVPFTATGNTTSTDVQSAIEEIQTELDGVDGTDDQDLTLTGNTLAISGDPNTDVDLSAYLDNTDSQNAGAVPFTATGNTTSTDVQSAIEEIQTELDGVDGTDDQDLTLTGNTLAISGDPNTDVDLSAYLDNTDSQNAGAVPFTATGNTTSTDVQSAIEEIQTELDGVDGTDDQDLTLTGNTLAISGDPNTDVDLSLYLDNTDSQNAGAVPFTATGNTTSTDVQSAIEEIQTELDGVDGTDDQDLTLTGNTLAISGDPNTDVDLSPYVNDDTNEIQNIGEVLADGNNAGGAVIDNIGTPVDGNDATTKAYVDGLADDDVSITNTVAGNRIATISETGITPVDINETVTSLSQNTTTGVISYTDEDGGAAETANVVSGNANNELIVGADGGASFEMADIDVDGDGATENTVDQAMSDITKITATAGRIFYPPSIAVDASTVGPGTPIDLYAQYVAQYGTPAVKSPSAPAAIPTYAANELHYYITYYDTSVFSGVTVSDAGVMNFTVDAVPTDYNSLINVVFVVK